MNAGLHLAFLAGRRTLQSFLNLVLAVAVLMVLSLPGRAFAQSACELGASAFQRHQWAQAAAAYADCEKIAPGKTDALLYRAKALVNLEKFADAAGDLESYTATNLNSDDALYLLGYVRFRQDQPRESLATFARATKIRPPQASDLKIAALDYVLLNDYEDAARYLEQSLTINPADDEARYHLGRVRYQQNKFDLAIAAFRLVLQHDPNNFKAHNNLGLCLEAKEQTSAAIAEYRKAIDLAKSGEHIEQPYLNLGKLLNTLNRPSEAVPVLTEAVRISPDAATSHYELGRAQFALGHLEDAQTELRRAIKLDPQNSSVHYLLGRVLSRMGKTDEAAAEFKLTENLIHQKNAKAGGMDPEQ